MFHMKLLILLMVVWNFITFCMMGIDKRRAISDKERISEKTLLTSSFIMGAAGIGAGAVSYTHLDVYKRQVLYESAERKLCRQLKIFFAGNR